MTKEWWARASAGVLALAVLLALAPPLSHALDANNSLLAAIWALLRMFTIVTNLLVGLIFLRIAWKGSQSVPPLVVGGAMLASLLVGIVFNLLLNMLPHQTIWDAIGDYIHHDAAPIMVLLWWTIFSRHGRIRSSARLVWALYPLGYCALTFLRAQFMPPGTGIHSRYPYFFMDADKLGVPMVVLNLGALTAAFVLAGFAAVAFDQLLARYLCRTSLE